MSQKLSSIKGFYQLTVEERLARVSEFSELTPAQVEHIRSLSQAGIETADALSENVIGTFNVPLGVATNLIINDEDVLVPMATEESSVIAAVSNAARQCRHTGGFTASVSGSLMMAQVQLVRVPNPAYARLRILDHIDEIREQCDEVDPLLVKHGGGFRDIEVRVLPSESGAMLVVHLVIDTRDAMGANAVNSMAETVAPALERWSGGKAALRILTNLADRRLARATATWSQASIGGTSVRDGIISAYQFAMADPYRATTHNKGIMNGISAVVLATGNDTRAIEAGAHAYACQSGQYQPLTHWEVNAEGDLTGAIELPLAVGIIGGATRAHPTAQVNLAIMGIDSASTLTGYIASVGLAQNFAALKALATEGIQRGHMALHAKNMAMMAGAVGKEIETAAKQMVEDGKVRMDHAEAIIVQLRSK